MGLVQAITYCAILVFWIASVDGSGCQHQCNCGFQWSGDDAAEETTTLRYEVMGGLIGAFSPLFLAGISYLVYKKCNGPLSPSSARKGLNTQPWRQRSWTAGGKISPTGGGGYDRPRGSTPISLYGETDDSFLTGNSSLPSKFNNPPVPGAANTDPGFLTSRYTNVHRNLPGNDINQWFKNVNTTKY